MSRGETVLLFINVQQPHSFNNSHRDHHPPSPWKRLTAGVQPARARNVKVLTRFKTENAEVELVWLVRRVVSRGVLHLAFLKWHVKELEEEICKICGVYCVRKS